MEAIGSAASIIAIIETTAAVFKVCLEYSLAVKDAKKDIQRLQDETSDVQKLLARVADLASEPNADELPALAQLLEPKGPLETCGVVMEELLHKLDSGKNKKDMKRFGLRALKWPFKSEDVDSTLVVLERCKSSFTLALATDQMKLTLLTNHDTQEYRKEQYKEKVVQWLANVEAGVSWTNHDDARKKHEPETGVWLLEGSSVYQQWKKDKGSLLWIWGMPGCGKTVMISSIIEDIKSLVRSNDKASLAYFYFDFGAPAKQNALNCARYLLSHLIGARREEVSAELKDLYIKKCNYGHEDPSLSDLTLIIEQYATYASDLYLVLDGLDEAPLKDGKRADLLEWLGKLVNTIGNLHLCASSRAESDVKEAFGNLAHEEIPMDEGKVGGDIRLYIQRSLSTHQKLKRLPPSLKVQVQETLFQGASGMFRWVDCQLDALKRCGTKPQIVEALKKLPTDLNSTYERILMQIPDEDVDHARRALWWLMLSRRPLTIEELAEAAVIDLNAEQPFDPEYRFFDPKEQLLEILGSLVLVTATPARIAQIGYNADNPDPYTPASALQPIETLKLSHFSVQEYMFSDTLRQSKDHRLRAFSSQTSDLEAYTSRCCLQYLFSCFGSYDKQGTIDDVDEFPLLPYSSQQWSSHCRLSSSSKEWDALTDLCVEMLVNDDHRTVWLQLFAPDQPRKPLFTEPNEVGGPLHYAAQMGLAHVLGKLVDEHGLDINARAENTFAPLHYAAGRRHIPTVEALIQRKADVNAQTRGGRTPLHESAKKGVQAASHQLLRAGATVDLADCDGWTALYYACESDHIDVARLLLKDEDDEVVRDLLRVEPDPPFVMKLSDMPKADPNYRTGSGGSALHQAAGRGLIDIVKLLLKHGAEVNIATAYGRTPLHQAAGGGSKDVVNLLLDAGANPTAMDLSNSSPRDLAEDNGLMVVANVLRAAEEAHTPARNPPDDETSD